MPADGIETEAYAHSKNRSGVRQGLREHLEAVADLAGANAAIFGAAGLGRAVGLWHDLGKYHPDFQRYLLEAEAGQRASGTGPDHKGAGARHAAERCEPLAFLVAGHHGGLKNASHLKEQLLRWMEDGSVEDALRQAPTELLEVSPGDIPPIVRSSRDAELFIRMLFSALVDADYLDTERHFEEDRARAREHSPDLHALWDEFVAHHTDIPSSDGPVAAVRREVYEACLAAAPLEPGIFRLTVPTGGGKTLSAMAFALRHALTHGLRRVIVAVPYTTITEQTAGVYSEVFGDDRTVLEHHSAIDPVLVDAQTETGLWGRLASENWDASVVVTTTVQLFESLFAQSTSKCRKLHRLAGSVIVLDEVQALPSAVMDPILDALRSLTSHYGTSVVLCTATQPALDEAPGFKGLRGVREIATEPGRWFAALRRVIYELPGTGDEWSWERAGAEMRSHPQALAVVNTVADALNLFDTLDDPESFHLSTLLCGAHRRAVLSEVRRRLEAGEPCRLVATQVVEAGVDIDFPLVLRALGPLDRVVQAAGRCNREGKLSVGRVVVFQPSDGRMPPGPYRSAADLTRGILTRPSVDLHDPALYREYFRRLFEIVNLDTRKVQELRDGLRYEDVAEAFRMIEDETRSVVVRYGEEVHRLLDRAQGEVNLSRGLLRRLQPYMVSVRVSNFEHYQRKGFIDEVRDGLFEWVGDYDDRRGLTAENRVLYV